MARRQMMRFLIALVVTMLVASLGNHTQPAAAQEGPDPALVLLASYNIPPTDEFLPLLNEAAGRLAATRTGNGADTGPTSAKAVIAAAAQDRAVRLKLTPHLLAVAMDAVATPNPTPTQEAFYRYFQRYYADQHQRVAQAHARRLERVPRAALQRRHRYLERPVPRAQPDLRRRGSPPPTGEYNAAVGVGEHRPEHRVEGVHAAPEPARHPPRWRHRGRRTLRADGALPDHGDRQRSGRGDRPRNGGCAGVAGRRRTDRPFGLCLVGVRRPAQRRQ